MTSSPSLPQRLSERSFQRFEKDLAQAVISYPNILELDVKAYNLSPVTLAARLRDAKLSYETYHWTSSIPERFFEITSDLIVVHRGEKVFIGGRKEFKGRFVPRQGTSCISPLNTDPIGVGPEDIQPAHLLCFLFSCGYLKGPIKVDGITQETVSVLEASFDVRIDLNPDGTWTIL